MNSAPASSRLQKRVNAALIALFFALLWLPTLDTVLHIDQTPTYNENRLLTRFPPFTGLDGIKKYVGGLEAYFNDHFGFRNRLIHWRNQWEYALFGNGMLSGVMVGRDDWLFYSSEQMVEHYRGAKQFTPQDLRDWQTLLERRRDWLAQRGIKYLFVVAPDKQSIYSEELPHWLTKIRPDTKLDQFVSFMRAHSTVEVLDLRPALREARRIAPTYFKTDTHWNEFGGFVAAQEMLQNLAKQLPGIEPLSLDSFEQRTKLMPGGDLANLLGLDKSEIVENNAIFLIPKPNLPLLEIGASLTQNPKAQGTMIVLHDSFGTALVPFLGYRFNKVEYVDSYELDAGLIEREKPIVVVNEMVERHLNLRNPNELMMHEGLK